MNANYGHVSRKMCMLFLTCICLNQAIAQSSSMKLRLTYPDGGETLQPGSRARITWTGISPMEPVTLEFSTNSGENWDLVAENVLGTSYAWTVPNTPGRHCLVRATQLIPQDERVPHNAGTTVLYGHVANVYALAWNPDGDRVVTAGYDAKAIIYDAASGTPVNVLVGHSGGLYGVSWSPDGRRIATASTDRSARIWNAVTGAFVGQLVGHGNWLTSIAYNPNGKLIATGSIDNTARIWDATTFALLGTLDHPNWVNALAWSPTGDTLATAGRDGRIVLWDVRSRTILRVFQYTSQLMSIAWSPDGKHLLTGSDDGSAQIWNVESGSAQKLNQPAGVIYGVAWSPEGSKIATANGDNSVRIWDTRSATEVVQLTGLSATATAVAWSPNRSMIAATGGDYTTRIWRIDSVVQRDASNAEFRIGTTPSGPPDVAPSRFNANGHFYEFVTGRLTWADARIAAAARTYQGLCGHLATITSSAENDFVARTFASGQQRYFAWIAGYEPKDDGVWRWGAGPENGAQFSQVKQPTSPFNYVNWQGAEPNDNAAVEDFAAMNLGATFTNVAPGGWIDSPYPNPADPIEGYIVEYEACPPPDSGDGDGDGFSPADSSLYFLSASERLHDNREDATSACIGMKYGGAVPVQGLQFTLSVNDPVLRIGSITVGSSIHNPSDWTLTYDTVPGTRGAEIRVLLYGHDTTVNLPAGRHDSVLCVHLATGNPMACPDDPGGDSAIAVLTLRDVRAVAATRYAERIAMKAEPAHHTTACTVRNSSLRGDVNGDGSVDVVDILMMTDAAKALIRLEQWQFNSGDQAPWNAIWARKPAPRFCDARNYGDDTIDIADIVLAANAIVEEEWPNGEPTNPPHGRTRRDTVPGTDNSATTSGVKSKAVYARRGLASTVTLCPHVSPDSITMHMENRVPVRGVQLKLGAAGVQDAAEVRLNPDVADEVELTRVVKDGRIRVLIYARSGRMISAGDRDLFTVVCNVRAPGSVHLLEPAIVIGEGNTRLAVDTCSLTIAGVARSDDATLLAASLTAVPNPFGDRAAIAFTLGSAANVTLTISDVTGREVARVIDGAHMNPGAQTAELDARGLPCGLYVIRLKAGAAEAVRTAILVR